MMSIKTKEEMDKLFEFIEKSIDEGQMHEYDAIFQLDEYINILKVRLRKEKGCK